MDQVVKQYGRIDVLVNNVGGTIWAQPYHKYTEEQVNHELERTLYPTMWYCLAVLPIMMEQQSGSIVNLGSQAPRGLYRLFSLSCSVRGRLTSLFPCQFGWAVTASSSLESVSADC